MLPQNSLRLTMKVFLFASFVFFMFLLMPRPSSASVYLDDEDDYSALDNYPDNSLSPNTILKNDGQKRACIRRNGNCEHRPNDCCFQSSCRCNLWGTNCKCQRMGLLQRWG